MITISNLTESQLNQALKQLDRTNFKTMSFHCNSNGLYEVKYLLFKHRRKNGDPISARKLAANRANGKLGGRPRKDNPSPDALRKRAKCAGKTQLAKKFFTGVCIDGFVGENIPPFVKGIPAEAGGGF